MRRLNILTSAALGLMLLGPSGAYAHSTETWGEVTGIKLDNCVIASNKEDTAGARKKALRKCNRGNRQELAREAADWKRDEESAASVGNRRHPEHIIGTFGQYCTDSGNCAFETFSGHKPSLY